MRISLGCLSMSSRLGGSRNRLDVARAFDPFSHLSSDDMENGGEAAETIGCQHQSGRKKSEKEEGGEKRTLAVDSAPFLRNAE